MRPRPLLPDGDSSGDRGAGSAFPSTRWSELALRGPDDPRAREAFEILAARYFRPVAAYVRARFAKGDDEAQEAAQEFFLWMLETGFLARADRERGSFRGLVKTSLANFLHDAERRRRTWKRGGTARFVDVDGADGPLPIPDAAGRTPEQALDDLWRRETLVRALSLLEAELAARGKEVTFRVFRDWYLGDEELGHAELAGRNGLSATDVSNRLADAKRRFRACLRAAVMDTVQRDDDLRAELAWLLSP